MKTIAIIPARGGSKRIERKNIRPFAGVPVIAYSIRAALDSGCFDEVMVSTDDAEIARVARKYGANVPFMRSSRTADDYATTADVIREVLDCYRENGKNFDILACIYATAPFVTASRIAEAWRMIATGRASAAFTCVEYSYPVQRSLEITGSGHVKMKFPEFANARSQDLPKSYHDAGQFYFSTVKAFEESGSLWGPDTLPIILPETEVQDLDTITDWELAELKYSRLGFPREFTADGYRFVAYPIIDEATSERILEGRNRPDVRANMVNTGEISPENHRRFVNSLLTRRDKQYYAVFAPDGMLIGSVNFEWTGPESMERGIWLFLEARNLGHSRRLLKGAYGYLSQQKWVKYFETRVRKENRASLSLENSLGALRTREDSTYVFFSCPLSES